MWLVEYSSWLNIQPSWPSTYQSSVEDEPLEMSQWAWQYTNKSKFYCCFNRKMLQVQFPPNASTFWKWSKSIKTANVRKFYLCNPMNLMNMYTNVEWNKLGRRAFSCEKYQILSDHEYPTIQYSTTVNPNTLWSYPHADIDLCNNEPSTFESIEKIQPQCKKRYCFSRHLTWSGIGTLYLVCAQITFNQSGTEMLN